MITTYTYDAAGNRTRLNVDGALTTYAYDAGNRLRRSQEVAGITTFTFDNNGNQRRMLSPTGDITTYTWTYENQLRRIEDPDNALTTYTWAPVNRKGVELRIAKETEDVLTNYLWDDQRLLMETDEVGAVEAEYTLQPQAYGPLVSQRRDSESSFYAFDALGSTAALTDDTQAVTDQYAYKPFGEVRSSAGITDNPFLWRGRHELYRDTDSGFYSLGRAQYSANLGRMVTQVDDNGDANQYAENEPVQPPLGALENEDNWRNYYEDGGFNPDSENPSEIVGQVDQGWSGEFIRRDVVDPVTGETKTYYLPSHLVYQMDSVDDWDEFFRTYGITELLDPSDYPHITYDWTESLVLTPRSKESMRGIEVWFVSVLGSMACQGELLGAVGIALLDTEDGKEYVVIWDDIGMEGEPDRGPAVLPDQLILSPNAFMRGYYLMDAYRDLLPDSYWASTFIIIAHEFGHLWFGARDPIPGRSPWGPNVAWENTIRSEMGLPLRDCYGIAGDLPYGVITIPADRRALRNLLRSAGIPENEDLTPWWHIMIWIKEHTPPPMDPCNE